MLVLLLVALLLPGCGPAATAPPATTPSTASAPVAGEEEWFLVRMGGSPCGWIRESQSAGKNGGIDYATEMQLRMLRGKDETTLRQEVQWSETAGGELVKFSSSFTAGPTPQRLDGHKRGANLVVQVPSAEGVQESVRPWPAGAESFSAIERRLTTQPLAAGKKIEVVKLDWMGPMVEFVGVEIEILEREPAAKANDPKARPELVGLWRAEQRMRLQNGQPLTSTMLWLDDRGRIQRAYASQLQQEIVRSTKAEAQARDLPPPDLFALSLVPLEPAGMGDALVRADFAEYRASVPGWEAEKHGDFTTPFAFSSFQQVDFAGGDDQFMIEVTRPTVADLSAWKRPPPGTVKEIDPASLESSHHIDWKHPAVQKLAKEVEPGASAAETALKLARKVHEHMKVKNFTQALGSASDAATTGEGDCTEHAFLLAALARAHGLPAGVAVGLVYVERPKPGFLYHMWTEIDCDRRWVPFDGTTGGLTHAGYIHVGSDSVSAARSASLFLPVQRLIGRLKLTLVSTKPRP